MQPLRLFVVVFAMPVILTGLASAAPSGFESTPAEVELTIGRTRHLLTEGVSTTIKVNGRDMPVRVTLRDAQTLQVDDFSFNYPSGFSRLSSASSGEPSSASWMLKGPSCQITVHRKDKNTTLNYLVDHMAEFYEGLDSVSDLDRRPYSMTMQGARISGTRFTMRTRTEGLTFQDYFQLPVRSSRYNYFLVIHGKPDDPAEEQARLMIGGTLK